MSLLSHSYMALPQQPRFFRKIHLPPPIPLFQFPPLPPHPNPNPNVVIREVWAANLDFEMALIASLINDFPILSIDTEFPGVIYRSDRDHRKLSAAETYQFLKANVDALNLIQLGITLSDQHGNLPDLGTNGQASFIWQINFRDFHVARDPHALDSVALLRKQGINFEHNARYGVPSWRFAKLADKLGLLGNDALTWVTFHGAYDFGYLVKILTGRVLPTRLEEYLRVVRALFGQMVYDLKHVILYCNGLYGGLDRVTETLKVERVAGKSHQAGSDSLLTCHAFLKIKDSYFPEEGSLDKHVNVLFGLRDYL